ncbi:BQ5605_C006g03941 [Microbotryum silenes-dioicae]|uniref:BQ5605_C006g03941 protein n=1 Tax=Microbotryum silenes-dioicae TaxID=796604 RepID=A0A2X0P7T3_9BASI|nr:BQ5605_C006g03941 [Microbotryum silenes-dioicae]
MPPPSHLQLAAAVLVFHRPSRVLPMHDARRSQPGLVTTDSLAYQHSTSWICFPSCTLSNTTPLKAYRWPTLESGPPKAQPEAHFLFFDILRTQNPENCRGASQKIDISGRNTPYGIALGPFAFASKRASRCSRLNKSLAIFANHFSSVAHDEMIPCLFLDEDQDYYLHDDDFDRLSPLTNITVAELLAFDVAPADSSLHVELSKDEPTQYSNLPYPTLQTRDAFLATDALINARKQGYRSLAVGSTCLPLGADRLWSEYDRAKDVQSWALRAQRWMDKIIVINEIDRNRIAVARRILNGLQWQEQDGLLPLPLLASGTSLVYLLRFLSQQLAYSRLYPGHDWLGEAAVNLSIESVLRAGRVQNPDFETSYGLIPSTVISLVMARPPDSDPHSVFKACFFGPPNQYRNLIELGDCMRNTPTSKSIWFLPLCSDSHWVLARINMHKRTWSVINSLSATPITAATRTAVLTLFKFLKLDIKNEFPHTPKAEQQEDSYSCGPATINAVETEVLGIGSFNAARAHMSRLRQFCRLSSLVGAVEDPKEIESIVATGAKSKAKSGRGSAAGTLSSKSTSAESGKAATIKPTNQRVASSSKNPPTSRLQTTFTKVSKPTKARELTPEEHTTWARDHPPLFRRFAEKVEDLCPGSNVDVNNPKYVRCGRCYVLVPMAALLCKARFQLHLGNKKCVNLQPISNFFRPIASGATATSPSLGPCPGLTSETAMHYLSSTAAQGGGAPPRRTLCLRLYPKIGKRPMTELERKEVDKLEANEWKWRNDHRAPRIISVNCRKYSARDSINKDGPSLPCEECARLPKDSSCRAALRRQYAAGATRKYTNKKYVAGDTLLSAIYRRHHGLEEILDDNGQGTVYLRFAQGVASGEFDGANILEGLVKAATVKHDRMVKGKSMRGFVRSEALRDFEQAMALASPMALRVLQATIGASTSRKLQMRLGLDKSNMDRVCAKLEADGLTFNLHVDDTKCRSRMRTTPYYSEDLSLERELRTKGIFRHELIGSIGPPRIYETPGELPDMFSGPDPPVAGTKIRAYMIAPNDVGSPAQVFAAFVIGETTNAEDATKQLHSVIQELIKRCVAHLLVSISADGAASEGVLQCNVAVLLRDQGGAVAQTGSRNASSYTLPSPDPDGVFPEITISTVNVAGTPIVFCRDEKHLAKCLRNAIDSGARLLFGGLGCIAYQDMLTILGGLELRRTLSRRDVTKNSTPMRSYISSYVASYTMPSRTGRFSPLNVSGCCSLSVIRSRRGMTLSEVAPDLALTRSSPKKRLMGSGRWLTQRLLSSATTEIFGRRNRSFPGGMAQKWWSTSSGVYARLIRQATGKVTALLELMRKFKTEAAGSRQGYHHTYNDLDDLDLVAMRTYPSDGDISLTSFAAANTARELLSGLRMWEPVQRIASNRRNQGPQPGILEDVLAHGTTVQGSSERLGLQVMHHHPTKEDQGLLRTELLDSALDGMRHSTCQGVVKLDPNEREAVDRAIRSLAALDFDVEAALLDVQIAYDEADRQAEERYVLETIEKANSSLRPIPTHLKLPPLVDARDTSFSLNWASLIAHRAAHECSHLRAVLLKGRPMELSDTSRGEAGLEISNTEQGRSAVHSRVLKGLVQSMGPSRFEDIAGTARSFRWTGGGQVARALTTNEIQKNAYIEDGRIQEKLPERDKQYEALAQRYPHFGSLDGAVTAATPLEIGSLICFGLKRGMHSLSCDQTAYGEEALSIGIGTFDNKPLQPRHARLVGSTLKCRRTGASPHQENMLFHTPH